jgi:hypothetical protein
VKPISPFRADILVAPAVLLVIIAYLGHNEISDYYLSVTLAGSGLFWVTGDDVTKQDTSHSVIPLQTLIANKEYIE